MPMIEPPALPLGPPVVDRIPAGTLLWRVHSKKYLANQRNPTPAPTVPGGGRFDSLAGSYPEHGLGQSEEGALAEAVFRDLPLDGRPRIIPAAAWRPLEISGLETTRDLQLTCCHGPALSRLGQDSWLTRCDPEHYVRTRRWAAAIRSWQPKVDGLSYRCRNDEDQLALVLFGPAGAGCLTASQPRDHRGLWLRNRRLTWSNMWRGCIQLPSRSSTRMWWARTTTFNNHRGRRS